MGIVVHTCNSRTGEIEAGEWQIPGQPWLRSDTLSKKKKKKKGGGIEKK
jgi:hypothetical protein